MLRNGDLPERSPRPFGKWCIRFSEIKDEFSPGNTHVSFILTSDGTVKDIHILSNTANVATASACVQVISGAHIPPIPHELASLLHHDCMKVEYIFDLCLLGKRALAKRNPRFLSMVNLKPSSEG